MKSTLAERMMPIESITDLDVLERRLADGEEFLAAHPDDKRGRDAYNKLLDRYVSLSLADCGIKVHFSLPEGCQWSPDHDSPPQSVMIVAIEGESGPGEWSYDDLRDWNDTMAMVEEAQEGE